MTEKDTGKPVEGAVIVLSWNRCWATPAGQSCDIFAVREALSDKEGNFYVSARAISFSIPVLTWIEEKRPIVFKPGYKFLVLEKKISKIALERVPTLLEVRKKEVDQAQQNYQTDVYATRIFKDKVFREEEFVECEGSIKPLRSSYFGRSARIWREFPLIQISPRDRDPRKVRQLIDDLDHEDAMVRKKAAQELGKMDIEEPELNALRRVI